jgi:predicted nucleotidyltransferase component of viral defense system
MKTIILYLKNIEILFMRKEFKTATDFRKSLEARLQILAANTGEDLQRLRRKVAFDRFLARIFFQQTPGFYLKGGYAMELRIGQARATKDIDLTCIHRVQNENELLNELILNDLQILSRTNLNDYFIYQVGNAQLDLENAPYGGARFPILTLIDGKIFVRFQLDVGADFLIDQAEMIQGKNWLEFCDIPAPIIPMISIEQQFAEKLHTYTLPRDNKINSRAKDLIDMLLLLKIKIPQTDQMIRAVQKVFKKRDIHFLPQKLDKPPTEWKTQFSEMAKECGISLNIQESFEKIAHFYYQILSK